MTEVLAIKPGKIKAADKKILRQAGVVVIEIDDPADLRMLRVEGPEIEGSELAWAALAAIELHGSANVSIQFTKNIRALVSRKMKARTTAPTDEYRGDLA